MATSYWAAVLDGDIAGADKRATRAAAERDAAWLRAHPARRDRVRMGRGRVEVLRVCEDEWTGEWVTVEPVDTRIAHASSVREYVLAERRCAARRSARETARPERVEYEQLRAIEISESARP